ncbi:MAG TPA: hypothetical protein VGM25_05515 [Caulobacteraceae bacterium]|jgi:hypothetical protein
MTRTGLLIAAFLIALAAPGEAVLAQQPTRTAAARRCCRVTSGTVVMVQLAEPVSTKTHKTGDTFAIRLAEPVVVRGQIVLPAGTTGVGEVTDASKPGMGGKGAKLVLSARSLTGPGGTQLPLKGLQLAATGRGHAQAATALGLGGIGFAPLGFVGIAIHGGDVEFPAGTEATAKLGTSATLRAQGKAPRGAGKIAVAAPEQGPIALTPPAKGMGQVVFFRKKSLLGTGQWFNVREEDKALGKLTNGAWFVQAEPPGEHTFTAKTEPEFKDKLTLKIDAGETYFVEGVLTHGVVIGVADLTPSDRSAFNTAAKDLKAAEGAGDDQLKEDPQEKAAAR